MRAAGASPFRPSPVVRALLTIRFFVGRLLGWDREPDARVRETFATRLTAADRSTAHAAAVSALVEMANAYRFYFGVYVRRVDRLTPVYMAFIDPVRRLIVYPSLLRSVHTTWNQTFGTA